MLPRHRFAVLVVWLVQRLSGSCLSQDFSLVGEGESWRLTRSHVDCAEDVVPVAHDKCDCWL